MPNATGRKAKGAVRDGALSEVAIILTADFVGQVATISPCITSVSAKSCSLKSRGTPSAFRTRSRIEAATIPFAGSESIELALDLWESLACFHPLRLFESLWRTRR